MIYPEIFEEKIGFNQIRQSLLSLCLSELGQSFVSKIKFSASFPQIQKHLLQTEQFKRILQEKPAFPSSDYYNLIPELTRIQIPGTFINQEAMHELRSSLETILEIRNYAAELEKKDFPHILSILESIAIETELIHHAQSIIDRKGEIKDKASVKLHEIRKKLRSKKSSVDKIIGKSIESARKSGWVADDVSVAYREGRLVIPVPATHKNRIRGFIHDHSATGQTVYIEPEEVFDTNNEIRKLESEEKQEIVTILLNFSDDLRPEIPNLIQVYQTLGLIDFIRAKARLAIQQHASLPMIKDQAGIHWEKAIHPLLEKVLEKAGKKAVPLSLTLDKNQRILVISGPNAGGKSVALKTIGLLQYMVQCGLLIPVKDGSSSGVFDHFFIDIGDEQSLENDLSTYSSHLLNMKFFSLHANHKTLFLIDEFGTGTEPGIGGAIAESILELLNEKKAFGVVTTHYANLKLMAGKDNGILNAAMLFDTQNMEPLYELQTGKPGSSFAFEIAGKIGFPQYLLDQARKKTNEQQLDFEHQLQQLEVEKKKLEEDQQKFNMANEFLNELVEKYEKLQTGIKDQKNKILEEARTEANEIILQSNRLIENAIKSIKESHAEKTKTKKIRQALETKQKKLIEPKEEKTEKTGENLHNIAPHAIKKIQKGDQVLLKDQGIIGEVMAMNGQDVTISFNSITLKTSLEKIERIDKSVKGSSTQRGYKKTINNLQEKSANFKLRIDVRGKRGTEAVAMVRQYIDDAVLLRISEVSILHGKGYGILRELIHDLLRTIPEIKTFQDEHIERGGTGITIVKFK